MLDDSLLILGQRSLVTILIVATPILGTALITGILISIFQAVTSIQDQTMTFVPKIFAVAIVIYLLAPWLSSTMITFTSDLLGNLGMYIS